MKIDAPCPQCGYSPAEVVELSDGKIWLCPCCGHRETDGLADIDSLTEALGVYDPEMVESWRYALGLDSKPE